MYAMVGTRPDLAFPVSMVIHVRRGLLWGWWFIMSGFKS
jgi:hypothetical protein